MATIDEGTRTQVVIGAAIAAGPGASEGEIVASARKIINLLSPGSAILAEFERVEKRDEAVETVKSFGATILGVDKLADAELAVVFLKAKPSEYHEDGKENVLTERVDSAPGLEMAKLAQNLRGHKVSVTVAVEKFKSGAKIKKSRVLRSIIDKGVDPSFDAASADFQVSYGGIDVDKLVSHGAVKKAA